MDKVLRPLLRAASTACSIAAPKATASGVGGILGRKSGALLVYGGCCWPRPISASSLVPPGFVPIQDKQYLVSFAQLPDGATLDRTEAVIRQMSDIALKEPGVEGAVAFPGLSINGFINSPSAGIVFVTLKPFDERRSADLSGMAIAQKLQAKFAGINRRLSSPSSRRRRCRAWAPSAASSCRSKTAPIRAMRRSTRR